jgi:hypothetical protein
MKSYKIMFKGRQWWSHGSPTHSQWNSSHSLHPYKGVDIGDEIDEGTNEDHILIDKCISLTQQLIKGMRKKFYFSVAYYLDI